MNNYDFNDDKTIGMFDSVQDFRKFQPQFKDTEYPSLIIIDNTRTIRSETLENTVNYIGREGNIPINSSIVSRKHGKIECIEGKYYFTDIGSLNGTYVNNNYYHQQSGELAKRVALKDGDVIRIKSNDPYNTDNVTIIFSEKRSKTKDWNYVNLSTIHGLFKIGRCVSPPHIKLDGMQVSKVHAAITSQHGTYSITDCNSFNGTIVNGKKISGRHILSEKDVISIASTKLIYSNGYLFFNSVPKGIHLDIKDISRVVAKNKVILDHVSLSIEANNLVAVIGGSGAGKTTFVNCINGFEPATSGKVFMNDIDLYSNYDLLKSVIGYVPQSDDIHDFLSIFDELNFTAKLRLSKDIDREERIQRVNKVIDIMGLSAHKDTLNKKLSGGQRKRVSIAMELVSDPDIFFLDEPTSGLDPEAETSLMKQLKYLSCEFGKTIVVITHTLQNIDLFDNIIFLAPGGKLCYFGSPKRVNDFFGVNSITETYEKVQKNPIYYVNKYTSFKGGLK